MYREELNSEASKRGNTTFARSQSHVVACEKDQISSTKRDGGGGGGGGSGIALSHEERHQMDLVMATSTATSSKSSPSPHRIKVKKELCTEPDNIKVSRKPACVGV